MGNTGMPAGGQAAGAAGRQPLGIGLGVRRQPCSLDARGTWGGPACPWEREQAVAKTAPVQPGLAQAPRPPPRSGVPSSGSRADPPLPCCPLLPFKSH